MDQALRAPTVRIAASLGTLFVLLLALPAASAQLPLEVNGLRGGRHVGSAGEISSHPRAVLGLGYAYTEGVLDGTDSHQRLFSEISAAYAPWRYLQFSFGLDARYDMHSSDLGSDSGGAFGTQLATRHAFQVTPALSLAARSKLRFPAATSVSRGFQAVSPEFGAIASYLFKHGELSLDLGYRIDRSEHAVAQPTALSRADLLAASISRYDAALLGALFALPIGPVTASAEWSWDVALGSGAPDPLASPMRVRLAAQLRWADRYVPGVELGLSPSARPSLDRLARIEPRVWCALTFGVVFERERPVQHTETVAPTVQLTDVERDDALLDLRVVDPADVAVAGASVQLASPAGGASFTTGQDGVLALTLTPDAEHQLTVTGEGFEPQQVVVQAVRGRQKLTMTLARHLPEGEIKGNVRSLRGGKPVRARITVGPIGTTIDTDEKGDFAIGVPPGQYTLKISAPGHEPQQRSATVERLGVTILVVDLRRAPK